ncbi:hypothetical protein SLEP1_g56015 [Rubroshorea leprosula]|uniref:Uncharacterized protein n=1 Tax=Rubroshorea leprosula TaxID=152421 RepID=A0AAV5MJS0_9ROSI|nr:hypothetical protein SLEP1_g56015 [Rubroshorea leprosula]
MDISPCKVAYVDLITLLHVTLPDHEEDDEEDGEEDAEDEEEDKDEEKEEDGEIKVNFI